MTKIIKNRSGSTKTILNKVVSNGDQIDAQSIYFNQLPNNQEILNLISSGDYIVNDGLSDLGIEEALAHVKVGTKLVQTWIGLLAGVGENAPEIVEVSSAAVGFKMEVGDKLFSNDKYESLVGNRIEFSIYAIVDNSITNRWVSFDINLKTININGGDNGNTIDQTFQFGPFEVPTTPNEVFVMSGSIPSGIVTSDNSIIMLGVERTDTTQYNKTQPINDPIVLFISKTYRKSLG